MPVARSYQSLEQIGEPYISNGKQYVNLRFKNGNIKPARWYTNSEYKKLYGEMTVSGSHASCYRPQKEVLGFIKDFIWIFEPKVGMNEEDSWFQQSKARYTKWWGWCFTSGEFLPKDLPFGYNPIKLPWEVVGISNGSLKSNADIERAINNFFEPNSAIINYPHIINERIEIEVKLEKTTTIEGNYGVSTLFRMIGVKDNTPYIWITTAKRNWQVGDKFKIHGTIKNLKEYKGEFQVILTRVNEVSK